MSNAFSLFYADISISDSSLGFVNIAAVQMSLIYTASYYLCNPYMYVRTHARCHNMWYVCVCVCVFRYCEQTHNTMKYTTDQSHLHHSPQPTHFTCCKKRAILLLLACESVVIKKSLMGRNSCGEMIISGVIVLCLNVAGRRFNWGAVVRSLRRDKVSHKQPDEASQCRTNSVNCSCHSVRSAHLR